MSRQNKVNKGSYDQAGRLTPDEMARERKKMMDESQPGREHERITGNREPHRDEPASSQDRSEPEE